MTDVAHDDLKDIDPDIIAGILANADAFIAVDERVDQIIEWGENELKAREDEIKGSGGTLQDFKKAASDVETLVAEQLQKLEQAVETKYGKPTE